MVERSEASVPTAFASWSRKVSIDQALVKEIKAMPDMSGRDAAVMDAVARAAVMEKLAMTSEAARIERCAALSRAERDAAEPQEQEAEERAFLERKAAEVAANKERIAQVEEFVGTSFDNLASTVEVGLQAIDSEVSRQTLAAERERELAMEAAAEAAAHAEKEAWRVALLERIAMAEAAEKAEQAALEAKVLANAQAVVARVRDHPDPHTHSHVHATNHSRARPSPRSRLT